MSEVLDYTQQCLHMKQCGVGTLLSTALILPSPYREAQRWIFSTVSAEWTEKVYLPTVHYELYPKQKSVNPTEQMDLTQSLDI